MGSLIKNGWACNELKKAPLRTLKIQWLGYVDSNHGNGRFRVCCLTDWLYPKDLFILTQKKAEHKFLCYTIRMSRKRKSNIKKIKSDYRYNEDDEKTIFEEIMGFVSTFLICSIVIIIVCTLIIRPNVVSGKSMYPTLTTGDRGFSNALALATEGIERGDIVTANMVNDEDGKTYSVVKRVIGLPGETIECKDEKIYIDGKELDESAYLDKDFAETWFKSNGYFNYSFDPVTLGEDEYFLMGDNRPISKDSREVGPIKEDDILAKDFMVLYPFSRFGYLQ